MTKRSIEKGDVIRLDYKACISENGKVFDTTIESAAKDADIFDEKYTYGPLPYIVGSGSLFRALDDAILKASAGKTESITIPCADAAGERNPKLVETHPIKEFYKQDINPYPGLEVSLGNRRGTVMSAGAGRVRVDFNNPLAGKDLAYEFTVQEIIDKPEDKAKAIVEIGFGSSEGFEFAFKEDKVVVTLPETAKFSPEWQMMRIRIVMDLREIFNVDTVEFIEVWSRSAPKEEDPENAPAEKPADDAAEDKTEKKTPVKSDKKPAAKKKE